MSFLPVAWMDHSPLAKLSKAQRCLATSAVACLMGGLALSNGPAAAFSCETVPSLFDQTPDNTITLTIGPDRPGATWGNTYFMLPRSYQAVRIRMDQLSSDVGTYPVKLIVRYSDDTIYEFVVDQVSPQKGRTVVWGPWTIKDPAGQKLPDMFNVKVQENYALTPAARGFTYRLTVEGCS